MYAAILHAAGPPGMGTDAIKATAALAGLCFAMWFLARIAKRKMGVGAGTISPGALKIVGKKPLDQRSALFIVEVGDRHILIGSSVEGGVSKIDDISPDEWASMASPEVEAPVSLQAIRRRRARPRTTGANAESSPQAGDDLLDVDAAVEAGVDDGTPDDEQRFATVGESFQLLLKKARDARDNRRASGDE